MVCRQFSDSPLSETVVGHCQLDDKEYISMEFYLRFKSFHSIECYETVDCQKWHTICLGLRVLISNTVIHIVPDNKIHGANMGPTSGRQDPGGPHVGPMNLAIWGVQ